MAKENRGARIAAGPVRGRIVAGARRHFLTHGFRGVTMDDVAKELGMSKKTLYAHFSSKIELLEAALCDKFAELEAELEHITSRSSADFLASLRDLLECIHRHATEPQPVFVRDLQREAPDVFHMVETRRGDMIQRFFGRLFAEGKRGGLVRKDITAEMITEILLAAIQALVNPAKLMQLGMSVDVGISTVITVILDGVLTVPRGSRR